MDGRFSQLWDFRAKTRPTTHSVAFVSMLNFSSYLSHDDLSCGIQRNLAHQILALAFKMLMAASAALCFASFLLVPSPELKMGKERSQSLRRGMGSIAVVTVQNKVTVRVLATEATHHHM